MKKIFLLIFITMLTISVFGCNSKTSDTAPTTTAPTTPAQSSKPGITGYVMDKEGDRILVVDPESNDYSSTGGVSEFYNAIWFSNAGDAEIGDEVNVWFDIVADSYPGQSEAKRVEKIPSYQPDGANLTNTKALYKALKSFETKGFFAVLSIEFDNDSMSWHIELKDPMDDKIFNVEVMDDTSNLVLDTGSKETTIRIIEGMEQEVEVINYLIEPYSIHYQLDESFGAPEIDENRITYTSQYSTEIKVSLEIIENTGFEEVVSQVQKSYEEDGFEDKGELEETLFEENKLRGKMQFFSYPIKGFYVYEIGENVLVITYQYLGEAGDGMYPLLESLRKSIW